MKFTYCNTDTKAVSKDISVLFPSFGKDEVLAVMSPHDDDAILGAGYAMLAAQEAGLLERVLEVGWAGLTAKESGRIGGLLAHKNRE